MVEGSSKFKAWLDMVWIYIAVYFSMLITATAAILAISFAYGIFVGIMSMANPAYIAGQLENIMESNIFLMICQTAGEIIGIVVLLVIWKFYVKRSFAEMGLEKKGAITDTAKGFLIGVVSIVIIYVVLLITGQLKISAVMFNTSVFTEIIVWFLIFCGVGVFEEVLSRGFSMSILKPINNKWVIILVPAIIFALLHGLNDNVTLLGLFNIVLIGILFAFMFIKRGSVWMPIGYHISWNFFQGNILGLNVSGIDMSSIIINNISGHDLLTGGAFGAEGGIITTIVIISEILFVYIFFNQSGCLYTKNS